MCFLGLRRDNFNFMLPFSLYLLTHILLLCPTSAVSACGSLRWQQWANMHLRFAHRCSVRSKPLSVTTRDTHPVFLPVHLWRVSLPLQFQGLNEAVVCFPVFASDQKGEIRGFHVVKYSCMYAWTLWRTDTIEGHCATLYRGLPL